MLKKVIKAYIKASVPNTETSSLLLRLLEDYVQGNLGGSTDASNISYDNTSSGLSSDNVQGAIDELAQGGSPNVRYETQFNGSNFVLNSDVYEFEIPQSIHLKGVSPTVQVFETISSTNHKLITSVLVNLNGDVTIQVTSSPDNRFTGKLIIL